MSVIGNAILLGGGDGGILTGTTPPTSSLGNDGDVYKQTFPIPANVTFVDYLDSSNAEYIDTGVIATQDIDVTAELQYLSKTYPGGIGVRTGDWTNMQNAIYIASHVDANNDISCIKTKNSASGSHLIMSGKVIARTKTLKQPNGYNVYASSYDDSTYNKVYVQSGNFSSNGTLTLFKARFNGKVAANGNLRIFRVIIFNSNVPIRDYLPSLDANNVACMWDNIAQEYVYNNGTGVFTYGSVLSTPPAELDPVYYVKQNGAWEKIA